MTMRYRQYIVDDRGTVWEPSSITGAHATITHLDGKCYGDVTTRRPSERMVKALAPLTADRYWAVDRHYRAMEGKAKLIANYVTARRRAAERLRDRGLAVRQKANADVQVGCMFTGLSVHIRRAEWQEMVGWDFECMWDALTERLQQ